MEGNKDEADKCLNIAESALREHKFDKAAKFIGKAQKLYHTTRAESLAQVLEQLRSSQSDTGAAGTPERDTTSSSSTKHTDTTSSGPGVRNRHTETTQQPEYTNDQLEAVKQIKKCKNYYEILGVSKEATDSDIKKAYRKLALLLHPDKNQAPGASEAFKIVGNAAGVLMDPKKRKNYDTFGAEDERIQHQHPGYQTGNFYAQTFTSDFAAEELFNMFFNGGNPQVFTRRGGRFHREAHQQHREPQGNYSSLLQMVPIIGLILLSMMSAVFISDPVYSLSPSNKFPVLRKTEQLKVPYYVKDNFHTEYHGSVRRLELSVEEDYITALRHGCHRERSYRESLIYKARLMADRSQLEQAQKMKMPSCENLQMLQGM